MKLISTDEIVFIGPGSEWFWTAVSGIVLAVTFVAIYRQLTLARSANAFTQLSELVDEWQGERLVRKRLAVLLAIREGVGSADVPDSPAGGIANYWEKVAALTRAGHVSRSLIAEGLGAVDVWWGTLAPWVAKVRTADANPHLFEHFEWLAATLVRLHPELAYDAVVFERGLAERLLTTEGELLDLVAMRSPIASGPVVPIRAVSSADGPSQRKRR